jgi:hypothetical protein
MKLKEDSKLLSLKLWPNSQLKLSHMKESTPLKRSFNMELTLLKNLTMILRSLLLEHLNIHALSKHLQNKLVNKP